MKIRDGLLPGIINIATTTAAVSRAVTQPAYMDLIFRRDKPDIGSIFNIDAARYGFHIRKNCRQSTTHLAGATAMNLWVWLPGLFALGVISMLLCMAFAEGCDRI
jgi:hypothetical protein